MFFVCNKSLIIRIEDEEFNLILLVIGSLSNDGGDVEDNNSIYILSPNVVAIAYCRSVLSPIGLCFTQKRLNLSIFLVTGDAGRS